MKVYRGSRQAVHMSATAVSLGTPQTVVGVVTVDGKPLPPRLDIMSLSPTGFDWGYVGNGPAQLAMAILADFFGVLKDEDLVLSIYQNFMWAFMARIEGDEWEITGEQIEQWLKTRR